MRCDSTFREQKLDVRKKRAMPQSIYNQIRHPTPKGINHCEMVYFVFCIPPTDHWELRKTRLNWKYMFWKLTKQLKDSQRTYLPIILSFKGGLKAESLPWQKLENLPFQWIGSSWRYLKWASTENRLWAIFLIMKVGNGKNHTKTNLLFIFCFPPKRDLSWWGSLHGGALAVEGVMDALDGGGAWVELSLEVQTKAVP